jgi:hypothetical protein
VVAELVLAVVAVVAALVVVVVREAAMPSSPRCGGGRRARGRGARGRGAQLAALTDPRGALPPVDPPPGAGDGITLAGDGTHPQG